MSGTLNNGETPLVTTGIPGLDHILCGGLTPHRLYLVEGDPGSGKTTLALQYLLEGLRQGEPALYVTLSETAEELRAGAATHGWSLDGIAICELVPPEEALVPGSQSVMFHPSEVELTETTQRVLAEVERIRPARLVFDSLAEMRLLAQNPLRYRRQILALKQYFVGRRCTVLLLDDRSAAVGHDDVQSIAHGVVSLERRSPVYGTIRRRLQVSKLRGAEFREGYHDFLIRRGGLAVFPRLVAAEHHRSFGRGLVPSGVGELDSLLGGGLGRGSSALLIGAAGAGKSSIATQYAVAAAERGERAAVYTFDESREMVLERSAGLGMDLEAHLRAGAIRVQQVDPAALSPGEFAHTVRQAVEQDGASLVVIDSLNGYLNAMHDERFLSSHLHELLSYLGQQGVTTLLIMAQYGLVGSGLESPVDASYLADTVLLFRYFEAEGEVRQAISVMKKRYGRHERSIRELWLSEEGIRLGPPLRGFQGILTGTPTWLGGAGTDERRERG